MTSESAITDEIRALIGKESPPVVYEVDKTTLRAFARACGYTDPLFYDEPFAKSKGYRSLPAPPGFLGHAVFDPHADSGMQRVPTSLTRVLNGGTECEYLDTVCAGDTLIATTRLADVYERRGSLGLMLFTTRETVYRRDGKAVAIFRGTIINY